MTSAETKEPKCQLLQWGRDRLIAEMARSYSIWTVGLLLQWGRDRLIAEMAISFQALPSFVALQWGRDRLIAEIASILTYSDFKDLGACLRAVLPRIGCNKIR